MNLDDDTARGLDGRELNGPAAHSLHAYICRARRFAPPAKPQSIETAIERLL